MLKYLLLLLPLVASSVNGLDVGDRSLSASESGSNALLKASEDAFKKLDIDQNGCLDLEEFTLLEKDTGSDFFSALLPSSKTPFRTAFINSFSMIMATEIGDKTFWLAALLAMKYNRIYVFVGCILALVVMTVLSVFIGLTLPSLLPRVYTHYAAALLFLYFGVQQLRDAYNSGTENEEFEEAEEELAKKSLEIEKLKGEGGATASQLPETSSNPVLEYLKSFSSRDLKIMSQAFTITFLAEWGDRSQISTIVLAASLEPIGVCIGGLLGHSICTGFAVLGGRVLSTSISERTVTYISGAFFLLCALHSVIVGPGPDE